MLRLLAFVFSCIPVAFGALPANAQEFDIPSMTISGGDLAHPVEVAAPDADAFRRRVNLLPRLESRPNVSGTRYVVTTSYWSAAVRFEDGEDALDVGVRGDYYADGGYLRVTLSPDDDSEEDVWMVLSLRQRAILDRYIRLANRGLIGEAPSTLDVLAAASATEVFGVQAGPDVVPAETAAEVMTKLAAANPSPAREPREPPSDAGDGFWLIVTLLEGRSLRYYYDGATLTEALGTERYDASTAADLLAAIAPESARSIEQEAPAGSLLWWPVMLGSGGAAIGVALWLRSRRQHV